MFSRRKLLKASATTLSTVALSGVPEARADVQPVTRHGGEDYAPKSGAKRRSVPTVCGQCSARCPAIGYSEQGRIVKIEGHPRSTRTLGRFCARGQAGVNQAGDPDRILYPMKRAAERGAGQWKRITWDQALSELAARMRRVRDAGHPERVLLQYGWIPESAERLVVDGFLAAFGSASAVGPGAGGRAAAWLAERLSVGGHRDTWDVANARYILNFGADPLEAGGDHVAVAARLATALGAGGTRMVTIDVRLSNTAARSHNWIPIRPGTDLALILAMARVVIDKELYRGRGESLLRFCRVTPDPDASVRDKVTALRAHLAPYTLTWAAEITGVPAQVIEATAVELASAGPACLISGRGIAAHRNGVETERALLMLAAITGNLDAPGTRGFGVRPAWQAPVLGSGHPAPRSLAFLDHSANGAPIQCDGQRLLRLIRDAGAERPEMFIWYGCNPVYANGDSAAARAVLADPGLVPYSVCVSPFYDESARYADLILPDATYLECWDWESMPVSHGAAEYAIRQPITAPVNEVRDFKDVCCQLAKRLDIPLGVESGRDYVSAACELTDAVREQGGFATMVMRGLIHAADTAAPSQAYREPIDAQALARPGILFDAATGVYWDWKKGMARDEATARSAGYRGTPNSWRGYLGQRIDGAVYHGFAPIGLAKTGFFEIRSEYAASLGLGALPGYLAVRETPPAADRLILTTFKVNVQSTSRSQNCKWLDEIHHANPAWLNPRTASARGIGDGDRMVIRSDIGELEAVARVTDLVAPGVVAIAAHGGHTAAGRYASGNRAPGARADRWSEEFKWWKEHGVNANRVIPDAVEPLSGQACWMDTPVRVRKA